MRKGTINWFFFMKSLIRTWEKFNNKFYQFVPVHIIYATGKKK